MTIKEIAKWGKDHEMDAIQILDLINRIRRAVDQYNTAWSAVEIYEADNEDVNYTRCGYRKYTTDEYVPSSYRSNFGWKNTYYQRAILAVNVICNA